MAWVRVADHEGGLAFLEFDVVDRRVTAVRVHNETNRVFVIVGRNLVGVQLTREFAVPEDVEITRAVPPVLQPFLDVGTNEEPTPLIPATFHVSTHLLGPSQPASAIP